MDKTIYDKYMSAGYGQSTPPVGDYVKYYKKNFGSCLSRDKNIKILEIGFGRGDFLRFLIQNGYRNFQGVEIGREQYHYVKERITDKVELIEDIFAYLADRPREYDAIVFIDVLEHIEKPEIISFLQAVRRALRPGGMALCRVPNIANPFTLRSRYRDFTHTVGFTKESLASVFYIAGFSQIIIKPESLNFSPIGFLVGALRAFFGIFIRLLCLIYGGDIYTAKNMLAISRNQ